MVKEQKNQAEDEQLFRQETQDVVPLKTSPRSESRAPRKASRTGQQHTATTTVHPTPVSPATKTEQSDSREDSSHRKNGVQNKLLQKLKRGRFPPGDQLDLHHETAAAGHTMLQDFITDAQSRRLQCIRIIHGKGLRSEAGPVLKRMVHQALREHSGVLAFTTLKPADGGSGAVDVLLKTS